LKEKEAQETPNESHIQSENKEPTWQDFLLEFTEEKYPEELHLIVAAQGMLPPYQGGKH
jgi:hypothetical protein